MAILNRFDLPARKIEIDLNGPEGNAFALLGWANRLGKELGYNQTTRDRILSDMRAGNYENLIRAFDEEFGDYVDLIR